MPDPFSIITGVIGICGGVIAGLNTLISTVSNTRTRYTSWRDCEDILNGYVCDFETTQDKLSDWKNTWYDDLRSTHHYIYFWGENVFEEVEKRAKLAESEASRFRTALEARLPVTSPFERVKWLCYRNDELKLSSTNFKVRVADLEEYSKLHYKRRHGEETDLDKLTSLKDRADEFTQWMDSLYKHCRHRTEIWKLLLLDPPKSDAIVPGEAFPIDFACEKQGCDHHLIAKLIYDGSDLELSWPAQSMYEEVSPKQLLRSPFSTTDPHQRVSRVEAAESAFRLAAWAFPLALTCWTTNLCSCAIDLVAYEENIWIPILDASFQETPCDKHTWDEGLQQRTLLLLAITLAEFILAEPIWGKWSGQENRSNEHKVIFERRAEHQGRGSILDEGMLLQEINRKGSAEYKKAVKCCFEFDYNRALKPTWSYDSSQFVKKVLQP